MILFLQTQKPYKHTSEAEEAHIDEELKSTSKNGRLISNSHQESYIPHSQVVSPIEATEIQTKFQNDYSRITVTENIKDFFSSHEENGSALDQSYSDMSTDKKKKNIYLHESK